MTIPIRSPVTYHGRPAQLITLPIPGSRSGYCAIMFSDTRAITVPFDELQPVDEKETGHLTNAPASI